MLVELAGACRTLPTLRTMASGIALHADDGAHQIAYRLAAARALALRLVRASARRAVAELVEAFGKGARPL